jgi:hypothetical protein
MKITKKQLKRIVKEEKAKLLRESVADMDTLEAEVHTSALDIADSFRGLMGQLFGEDPEMFQGRSTEAEWQQQVDEAGDELEWQIVDAINKAIGRVENQLHDGQYYRGPHKRDPAANRPR